MIDEDFMKCLTKKNQLQLMLPEKSLIRGTSGEHFYQVQVLNVFFSEDFNVVFRFVLRRLLSLLLTVKIRASVMHHPVDVEKISTNSQIVVG